MKELLGGCNDVRFLGKGLHDSCSCTCNDVCLVAPTESLMSFQLVAMFILSVIVVLLTSRLLLYVCNPWILCGTPKNATLETVYTMVYTSLLCVLRS